MIRQSTVLLASVLSLAVTAAIARDEINKPVQLAQADKGAVVNPAAAAKKQADGADDVLAGRKAAKSIDKPGTIANKGLAVPQVSPAGKGAVAGTQSKSAAPFKSGIQAGEHPPGEQGGKGGGPQGGGQLKSDASAAAAAKAAAAKAIK